jgi:8-oxo-dGTP pyrophosphatase MutT (NUDIX family)
MSAHKTRRAAGCVVYRHDAERGLRLLLIYDKYQRWTIPKGHIDPGERSEQTAVREVREETGLTTTVRAQLGDVTYWYRRGGRRVRKTVRFFLCDFVEGSTDDHDHEVTEARWIPLLDARESLTYPGEREMVRRAIGLLARTDADR